MLKEIVKSSSLAIYPERIFKINRKAANKLFAKDI